MSRPKIIDVVPATRQRPWPKSRDELVRLKLELDKKHQRLHKLLVDAREHARVTGIRADQDWYDSMLDEIRRVNRLRMEAESRLSRMKSNRWKIGSPDLSKKRHEQGPATARGPHADIVAGRR